eukprot:COSAG01_NODE_285_length_19434_cov_131.491777_20_plen_221_part_00
MYCQHLILLPLLLLLPGRVHQICRVAEQTQEHQQLCKTHQRGQSPHGASVWQTAHRCLGPGQPALQQQQQGPPPSGCSAVPAPATAAAAGSSWLLAGSTWSAARRHRRCMAGHAPPRSRSGGAQSCPHDRCNGSTSSKLESGSGGIRGIGGRRRPPPRARACVAGGLRCWAAALLLPAGRPAHSQDTGRQPGWAGYAAWARDAAILIMKILLSGGDSLIC